ncbi:hypothetical protein MGSAQ_002136, partial [marine sediment metagenome]
PTKYTTEEKKKNDFEKAKHTKYNVNLRAGYIL